MGRTKRRVVILAMLVLAGIAWNAISARRADAEIVPISQDRSIYVEYDGSSAINGSEIDQQSAPGVGLFNAQLSTTGFVANAQQTSQITPLAITASGFASVYPVPNFTDAESYFDVTFSLTTATSATLAGSEANLLDAASNVVASAPGGSGSVSLSLRAGTYTLQAEALARDQFGFGGFTLDQFNVTLAVPEPGSLMLMILGVCGLHLHAWRRVAKLR